MSAVALALACGLILLTPLAAQASGTADGGAFVPKGLKDAAKADPEAAFKVILQGTEGKTSDALARDVQDETRSNPGNAKGLKKRFASINGVAAEVTGKQLLKLAAKQGVRAITRDAPVAASEEAPPVSTYPPTIVGTPQDGETLSATSGTWSGSEPLTYTYQWQRCDGLGAVCTDLVGAFGQSYAVTLTDVGSTLRVVVTATNTAGSASAASSVTADVVGAPPPHATAPVLTAAPTISGTAQAGQTLAATSGGWSGAEPLAYAYQWERCDAAGMACADIAGAAGQTYLLATADVDASVRVTVTATNAAGSASASSAATAVVVAAPPPPPVLTLPASTAPPTISGNTHEGETLTAASGAWSGSEPLTYAYRWQRCGGYRVAVLDDAPAGYWRLGEAGATAADASGNGFAGSYATAVHGTAPGVAGDSPATRFDGVATSVDVPGIADSSFASAFTLEAWVNAAAAQKDTGIVGKWRYDDGGGILLWIDLEGHYTLALSRDPESYLTTTVNPTVGGWDHVVGTWDGTTLHLYVNGAEIAAKPFSGDPGKPTNDFEIGNYGASSQYVGGALDEVAFYERALSASRVRAHYDAACRDIEGATGTSYVLGSPDVGSTVRALVSATNAAGSTAAASEPSALVVALEPPANTAAPTIAGAARDGETLTATAGAWTGAEPLTYAFQWRRCDTAGLGCTDITGATDAAYAAKAEDVGGTLRVVVTAANRAGSLAATSAATDPVAAVAPVSTATPTVAGTAREGTTLTTDGGSWSGTGPLAYTYRWRRCDGVACTDIADATDSSYTVTETDVGTSLRVVVTGSNSAGSVSATSPATGLVADLYSAAQKWPAAAGLTGLWPEVQPGKTPAIAIIDSGIDASRADFGGRVVEQVTLTTLTPNASGDGRGHGTFVASIAAGEAPDYAGAAPDAKLVSLDVMDDQGMAMTSDVIAAADWICQHKDAYGIRVANLSLTGTVETSFRYDPLNKAMEKLWFSGVVVVAAAGNYAVDGKQSDVPYPPGNDPFVITVGAADIADTISTADDFTAPWSAWGYTRDGFAKPDLSAPGRYMVGAVPPTATLAAERPERIVAPGYMQLSGTSFAAPVVAGVAAELLARHPGWTPDQVKGALMRVAQPVPVAVLNSAGVGVVDAPAAAALTDPPNPNLALNQFLIPDPNGGPVPIFDDVRWADTVTADPAWAAGAWGSGAWGSGAWGSGAWGSAYWSSGAWGSGPPPSDGGGAWGSTSIPNNATGDFLASGGYWLSPRP